MKINAERIALLAAVLIVLGGYLFAYRPLEVQIAQGYADLDAGRAILEQRAMREQREAGLRIEQTQLERWLHDLGLRAERPTVVARFLRTVNTVAATANIQILGVAAASSIPAARPQTPTLDEIPLVITTRGRYRDTLQLVRDLDRAPIAARITFDALDDGRRSAADVAGLRATLNVVLLREGPLPMVARATL